MRSSSTSSARSGLVVDEGDGVFGAAGDGEACEALGFGVSGTPQDVCQHAAVVSSYLGTAT